MTRQSRFFRILLLAFLFFSAAELSAQTIRTDSLFSISLGRLKKVTLLVPKQTKRMPVLFLLHGFGGDNSNWVKMTGLTRYVGNMPLLVVMPDGENSWYVNHIGKHGERFEDFITNDLLTYVRSLYSIDTTRVAIAGLSMGGYGALVLGMRHPRLFSFIGALSASLDIPRGIPDLQKNGRVGLRPSLVAAFGAEPSKLWGEYDPFKLLVSLPPKNAPYLYLANGIQDDFGDRLLLYRTFADSARAHGLHYEYRETPGKHDWGYWDQEIRGVISRLREQWQLSQ